MDRNRLIGGGGRLPWHLPADLRHFKTTTLGKPVVMGGSTHQSIGKPLPDRTNIVLTRNDRYRAPGCIVVSSLEQAIEAAAGEPELMIIGGAELYQLIQLFFPGFQLPDPDAVKCECRTYYKYCRNDVKPTGLVKIGP